MKRLQLRDLDTYQQWSATTAIYPEDTALAYTALGLASEAGEVAGKVKKIIRDGGSPDLDDALHAELGDVLWYVARLADELGLDLSTVAFRNVVKLEGRAERGTLGGSGDDR